MTEPAKATLKQLMYWILKILSAPVWLLYLLLKPVAQPDELTTGFSQFVSLIPGKTGVYLRKACLETILEHCHTSAFVSFGTLFSQRGTQIHDNVYIGPQCNIGKCIIERNCLLGSGVHIMSGKGQHNFADLDTPIKDQGGSFTTIRIGEDSWLGNGALIMANVGKKCIVAAGAVVVDDVPDYSIVAGNPARIIKNRLETSHSIA